MMTQTDWYSEIKSHHSNRMGLSNKSLKLKITPIRVCLNSDRGEIVKKKHVRQPLFYIPKYVIRRTSGWQFG